MMMLARDVAATGCGSRVQFWPCSRPRASRGSSTSGTGLIANATGLAQYPAAVAPQDWRQPIRQAPPPPAQHLPPSRPPPSATPPQDTTHTVDVQLMVKYSCNFGQHLAVVSSNQGWDTSSASQLTWAAGDKWSTVLSLPVGSDVEYKYVVMEGSHVQRWQEGPNNRLALHTPGVLVQVTDCWSRESRQVYELGLPAAAWQQPQQRQKHGSGAAAAAAAAGSRLHDNMGRLGSAAAPQEDAQLQLDLAQSQAGQDAAQAQQFQHSEHGITVEPDALTLEVSQLIPMLQHELQLALEALASHPGHDCSEQAALLAEGEAVLAALRRQEQHSSSPAAGSAAASSNGSGVGGGSSALSSLLSSCFSSSDEEGLLDEVEAAFASCSPDSALAAAATSATVTHAAAAAAAAAAAESVASLSQQLHQHSHDADTPVRGSSPGSSVGSAMASEDDITAALLSDDFEDACLCLHDAICSCQEYAHLPECRGYHSSSSVSAEPAAEPAAMQAADAAVVQLASSTAASSTALQPSAAAKAAAATGELVPTTAVAVAASYADAAAARAAAFAGVQEALERSGALLDALADPTHPLMLAADRELAAAKRQMGHLLAA